MPDYKEMYLKLFCATGSAVNTLIEAQRECEEMYLSAEDTEIMMLPVANEVTAQSALKTPIRRGPSSAPPSPAGKGGSQGENSPSAYPD